MSYVSSIMRIRLLIAVLLSEDCYENVHSVEEGFYEVVAFNTSSIPSSMV
jgi:hypothetical protein